MPVIERFHLVGTGVVSHRLRGTGCIRWPSELSCDFLIILLLLWHYHSIPDPTHLHSALPSPKKAAAKSKAKQVNVDPTALFVKPRRVSAVLVPSGLGVQDWSSFGQCLCIDWFPGNQHTRIAAGYYNGTHKMLCRNIVVHPVGQFPSPCVLTFGCDC